MRESEEEGRSGMAQTAFIIGDSISNCYTPLVKERLASRGLAVEWFYGGCSAQLLAGLSEWIPGSYPTLIQFNCGLHDARFFRYSQTYQQPIDNYQCHLRGIVKWLRTHTPANLLWASTTPVISERIMLDYVRFETDILAYNAVARSIMEEAGIPILDLHADIMADSVADCLSQDGVHMTERGNAVLVEAVEHGILAVLGMESET